jgi:hypothetical protein
MGMAQNSFQTAKWGRKKHHIIKSSSPSVFFPTKRLPFGNIPLFFSNHTRMF